jgi:serine/threonine protein kinase
MQELAKLSIVHRDLAARNILLDKWIQAKVGDFGLAREGGEYSNARTKFPVRWTAPEALKYKVFTVQRLDTQMIRVHPLFLYFFLSLFLSLLICQFISPSLSVSLYLSSLHLSLCFIFLLSFFSFFSDIFSISFHTLRMVISIIPYILYLL